MKYINLSYPEMDIEDRFKRYLETEYLPYLKNRKSLQAKYERYKSNRQQGINAFLDYQNGINLTRLYLLIDSLYQSIRRYDDDYSIVKDYDIDIPYVQKMESIQKGFLTNRYRKLYINFLLNEDIIQCDDIYYSADDDRAGAKALGYRIHPRLYAKDIGWNTKRFTISEKIYDRYTAKNKVNKHRYSEPKKSIYKMMKGWSIDTSHIPKDLNKYVTAYTDYKNSRNHFTNSGFGHRIYSAESGIKKELRPYLYHEDHPDVEYKMIEISNCHVYTLANLIVRQKLNLVTDQHINLATSRKIKNIQDELNCLNSFATLLESKVKTDKEYTISFLSDLISENEMNFRDAYKSFIKGLKYQTEDRQLIQLFESKDQKYFLFIVLACSGLAYDVMASKAGKSRKYFKGEFTAGMNLDNKDFCRCFNLGAKFLKVYFNDIYLFVVELKRNSNKNFLHQNAKIESNIMINYLSQYLIEKGVPFINIHDGIILPKGEVEEACMQLELQQLYPLQIPFKIQNITE